MYFIFWLLNLLVTLFHITGVTSIRLVDFNETGLARGAVPTVSSTSTTVKWPDDVACDFDSYTTCGWGQVLFSDDFDWKLGEGKDSHRKNRRRGGRTGTKDDHGGDGGYMYIKAGRWNNRTAKLRTLPFDLNQDGCFKFWYHMRGRHMGHLKLYEIDFNPSKLKLPDISSFRIRWELYGSQGGLWQQGAVAIKPPKLSNMRKILMFEAFDWDKGPSGNIVLDDITFDPLNNPSDCAFSPSEAAPPVKGTTTTFTTKAMTTTPIINSEKMSTAKQFSATTDLTDSYKPGVSYLPTFINSSGTLRTFLQTNSVPQSNKTRTFVANSTQSTTIIEPFTASDYSVSAEQSTITDLQTNISISLPSGGLSTKHSKNISVVGAAVGIVIGILVLVAATLCFLRNQKRRRFNYYDNSTVHMTRMSPDAVDTLDTSMIYQKLA
ncbi:uncharacterized protein LOC120328929 [Styela clava]